MSDSVLSILTLISALGSALVAGIFFAFSAFVMKALARIPPAQGIAAMQSINITVINPWFMTVFLGTVVTSVILVFVSVWRWAEPGSGFLLSGGLAYFIGTFLVTMVCNVPRNNALAAVDPVSAQGEKLWESYVISWTAWNHVRTAAALTASIWLLM